MERTTVTFLFAALVAIALIPAAASSAWANTSRKCANPPANSRFDCGRCPDVAACLAAAKVNLDRSLQAFKRSKTSKTMKLKNGKKVSFKIQPGSCYRIVADAANATFASPNVFLEGEVDTKFLGANRNFAEIGSRKLATTAREVCPKGPGTFNVVAWTGKEWTKDGNTKLQVKDAGTGTVSFWLYKRKYVDPRSPAGKCLECKEKFKKCQSVNKPHCSQLFANCREGNRLTKRTCAQPKRKKK